MHDQALSALRSEILNGRSLMCNGCALALNKRERPLIKQRPFQHLTAALNANAGTTSLLLNVSVAACTRSALRSMHGNFWGKYPLY